MNEKPPVKSYCGGIANYCTPEVTPEVDVVNMTPDRVDETAKGEHEPFIYIREDTEMPFGGYEHCGQHDAGAFPVYLAPPKREWVGLTDEDYDELLKGDWGGSLIQRVEAKLREKKRMKHEKQEGGDHYRNLEVQPWEALESWMTKEQFHGFLLGSAVAYLARFNVKVAGKGGLTDIKKARHYLEALEECLTKTK